jgi:hypothetical protein
LAPAWSGRREWGQESAEIRVERKGLLRRESEVDEVRKAKPSVHFWHRARRLEKPKKVMDWLCEVVQDGSRAV